ncbi:MAG: hypothetical protein AB7F22_21340 [Reyranella sp.]|uniref:hypothetical protein n=1 Tax=Reyranella sp. TaxID=1929291 RepID=UPI003D0B0639
MVKRYRKAVSALLAFGLAGALVGPWVGPAAASDRVCYFGECRGENAAQSKPRVVSKRGSWSAVVLGKAAMIVDEFANGARFAILAHADGKLALLLSHPDWRLKAGQRAEMSVRIDGETYKGTAVANETGVLEVEDASKDLLKALYRGRKGRIEVGDYSFDMTNLADAAAVIDDAVVHLKASR